MFNKIVFRVLSKIESLIKFAQSKVNKVKNTFGQSLLDRNNENILRFKVKRTADGLLKTLDLNKETELKKLYDDGKYEEFIRAVAECDYSNRTRPHQNNEQHSPDNVANVRALTIYEELSKIQGGYQNKDFTHIFFRCFDEESVVWDIGDILNGFGIDYKDFIPYVINLIESEFSSIINNMHDRDRNDKPLTILNAILSNKMPLEGWLPIESRVKASALNTMKLFPKSFKTIVSTDIAIPSNVKVSDLFNTEYNKSKVETDESGIKHIVNDTESKYAIRHSFSKNRKQ